MRAVIIALALLMVLAPVSAEVNNSIMPPPDPSSGPAPPPGFEGGEFEFTDPGEPPVEPEEPPEFLEDETDDSTSEPEQEETQEEDDSDDSDNGGTTRGGGGGPSFPYVAPSDADEESSSTASPNPEPELEEPAIQQVEEQEVETPVQAAEDESAAQTTESPTQVEDQATFGGVVEWVRTYSVPLGAGILLLVGLVVFIAAHPRKQSDPYARPEGDISPALSHYLVQMKKKGYTPDQVRRGLVEGGYDTQTVKKAMQEYKSSVKVEEVQL